MPLTCRGVLVSNLALLLDSLGIREDPASTYLHLKSGEHTYVHATFSYFVQVLRISYLVLPAIPVEANMSRTSSGQPPPLQLTQTLQKQISPPTRVLWPG